MVNRSHFYGIGCCSGIAFIFFIIFLATYLSPLIKYNDFHPIECNITKVDYPITFPTPSNTENWVRCDCGKRCWSWSPCINIYSDINPDVIIHTSLLDHKSTDTCTFHNDNCRDGENLQVIERYLNESREIYDEYIYSNRTCYTNEDLSEIYFDIDLNWGLLITLISFFGIALLFICGILCCYYRERYNEKKLMVENQSYQA